MKKLLPSLAGFVIFIIGTWLSYRLLARAMITSGDFVTLELAVITASLVISFLTSISEISLSSFAIKLREAKVEAQVTLQKLESLVVATFEPQLQASRKGSGQFGDARATQDPRIPGFLALLDSIERAGVTHQLSTQIRETAKFFALVQLQKVGSFAGNDGAFRDVSELPSPDAILPTVREDDLADAAERFHIPVAEIRLKLDAAIDAYRRLYELAVKSP